MGVTAGTTAVTVMGTAMDGATAGTDIAAAAADMAATAEAITNNQQLNPRSLPRLTDLSLGAWIVPRYAFDVSSGQEIIVSTIGQILTNDSASTYQGCLPTPQQHKPRRT